MATEIPAASAADMPTFPFRDSVRRSGWFRRSSSIAVVCFIAVMSHVVACSSKPAESSIDVFAAASVADSIAEAGRRFEAESGCVIRVTQGASGILCRQIELGAPCDVYVPAHPQFADRLSRDRRPMVRDRRLVARNRLVLAIRIGFAPPAVSGIREVAPIHAAIESTLKNAERIAIANPAHAPAGQYAMQILRRFDAGASWNHKIVYADDVRLAARYVAEQSVDCAMIFGSDAMAFEDRLGSTLLIPAVMHDAARYEACVLSDRAEAFAFVEFLASHRAADIWRDRGFDADDYGDKRRDSTIDVATPSGQ